MHTAPRLHRLSAAIPVLSVLLTLSLAPHGARASLSSYPFALAMDPESPAAAAGLRYETEIHLVTGRAVTIGEFALQGSGWTVHELVAPSSTSAKEGDRIAVRFAATPFDPDEPLWLTFVADGKRARQRIDLSPERIGAFGRALPLREVPGRVPTGELHETSSVPAPALGPDEVPVTPSSGDLARARTITVSGRFAYTRDDGVQIGGYGLTAKVFDHNGVFPALFLGSAVTNSAGDFEVTFSWSNVLDPDPDLYVEFTTESSRIRVQPDHPLGVAYKWSTGIRSNYTGTSLDLGTAFPGSEDEMPRVHILTNGTRAWSYVEQFAGYDAPLVTYLYPSPNWPAYTGLLRHIYVPEDYGDEARDFQWREATHIHEWGHHFITVFGQSNTPAYCNGYCDENPEGWLWEQDCGHCVWCEETARDAFGEGWPNWLADVVTRRFNSTWGGIPALYPRPQEDVPAECLDSDGNSCPCLPEWTEGFFGALLRDIEDATQDDHDGDGLTDALALGIDEIFHVVAEDDVATPAWFLERFEVNYPQHHEALWETAFNVGYDIDELAPGTVTNFTSPSHATTGDSPDRTVELTWVHASDDRSGIAGYSIAWNSTPMMPDTSMEVDKVTSFTTPSLSAGTWYFTIRARDRSGKSSSGYATYGPVVIRAAEPANLRFAQRSGWADLVVPRSSNDATTTSVLAPLYLDPASLYVNLGGINDGETAIPGQTTRVYLDDVYRYWMSWNPLPAGSTFVAVNQGPITLRGGRHLLEVRLDALEEIPETDETDNSFARQWVWGPPQLQPTGPLTFSQPPDATAGWSKLPSGTTTWFNADGYRMTAYQGFDATVVFGTNTAADYDVRLHAMSTGPTNGFTSNVGSSTRPAGCIDAVLTNAWQTGLVGFDVGVVNRYEGTGSYVIENVSATTVAFGDSSTVPVGVNQMFVMREFEVTSADTGPVSITLQCDPAQGPWHLMWFDDQFVTGDLLDHDGYVITDADGRARLDVTIAQASSPRVHAVVFFRDPKDTKGATSITYEIGRTLPDLVAWQPANWHAPLVPRAAPDGSVASVPAPEALPGDAASTYFNLAVRNASPVAIGSSDTHLILDGVYGWFVGFSPVSPNVTRHFNWTAPWTVRGGRHTLSLRHDVVDVHEELSEDNNVWGEQWMWTPSPLPLDSPVVRAAPPDRTGGWADVRSDEQLWFNADGLRSPTFALDRANGWFAAVAVMPGTSSNVDVRLHEVSTGAKDGFASNLGYSGWGTAQSDFVVVNFEATAFRAFDVGALGVTGTEAYTAQARSSLALPVVPVGTHGPHRLEVGEVLDLYHAMLDPGVYVVRLDNRARALDLGLSVYGPDLAIAPKSATVAGGAAWSNPAGDDEWVTLEVTRRARYAFAVWKVDSASLAQTGSYYLEIDDGITAVGPDVVVRRTALEAITPNPFNPQTAIAYAVERAGGVEIVVYNLRGELVRTLVREERPAGRHEVIWNGRDDRGRPVASGVYTVMLRTGGVEDRRKVTLVK